MEKANKVLDIQTYGGWWTLRLNIALSHRIMDGDGNRESLPLSFSHIRSSVNTRWHQQWLLSVWITLHSLPVAHNQFDRFQPENTNNHNKNVTQSSISSVFCHSKLSRVLCFAMDHKFLYYLLLVCCATVSQDGSLAEEGNRLELHYQPIFSPDLSIFDLSQHIILAGGR